MRKRLKYSACKKAADKQRLTFPPAEPPTDNHVYFLSETVFITNTSRYEIRERPVLPTTASINRGAGTEEPLHIGWFA